MALEDTWGIPGVIYILHFTQPLGDPERPRMSASHYVGWTGELESRLSEHRAGGGAKIIRALFLAGGDFKLAASWEGTRYDERRLKKNGHFDKLCPICKEAA